MAEERYEIDDDEFGDEFEESVSNDDSLPSQSEKTSVWIMIRRFFFKTASEKDENNRTRLYILNQAIETYPDAAANYLLRGELHTKLKQFDRAEEDFEKAIALTETQFDTERWGLGSQAIQDRARRGLQRIVR